MIKDYVAVARPSHWFKNVLIFPGMLVASIFADVPFARFAGSLVLGLMSACLIASANYTINEWLDAEFDRFHPVKKDRPSVRGKLKAPMIYLEYGSLAAVGLTVAWFVSKAFLAVSAVFLVMGVLYNVSPFRTKDKAYLDVLSESFNNPIRLLLGWLMVTSTPLPPSSFVLGYWMGGAFLMGMKRYAEYRYIGDPEKAGLYRRSFRVYSEQSLLISSYFYSLCSAFFLGIFLIKYRIELLLSFPLFAVLFAWYLYIAMKPNSLVQNPERLYREPAFLAYMCVLVGVVCVLLFVDIPGLRWFLQNVFVTLK